MCMYSLSGNDKIELVPLYSKKKKEKQNYIYDEYKEEIYETYMAASCVIDAGY